MSATLPSTPPKPASSVAAKPIAKQAPSSGMAGKLLGLLVLLGMLGGVGYGAQQYFASMSAGQRLTVLTHTVAANDMLVTVTEDGNLESASNLDIKCQVAGGSSILWIVPDGSTVKKGDKLVELDASVIDESINTQKIAYEKARSTKIQAEKNFEVAKLAVQEYLEGTFKQGLQDADKLITISMENLRSAENSLQHAERMFRKGYVSSLELEGQRFAVERAKLELGSAQTAKDVLVNFTKVKTLQDLESQRDTAEATMRSEQAAFELEEIRLKRLESQMEQCTIVAPQDGMVVYANEQGGRFNQQQGSIEEGAAVRERQTILRLPDLARMQVKVNVHESKVDQLEPGMRARIRILDRDMTGTVTSIANQPESTGWFSANVKEYATHVRIDGEPEGLRPGMTAEVEILVAHLKNATTLPVAAVVEQRGQFFCWIKDDTKYERRTLKLGMSNDYYIEVQDGVSVGDEVLLNPRSVVPEAKATLEDAGEEMDIKSKFGEAAPGDAPRGDRPGGPGAGGPGAGPGAGVDGPSRTGGPGPGGPGAGGPGAGGPGGGGAGGRMNPLQFDKDGDGKVSKEEAPPQMQERFDMMDTNGDGFIDRADMDALRQRFQQGGGPGGPGGGPGGPGGPGGARP